jgi:hypothetical protein
MQLIDRRHPRTAALLRSARWATLFVAPAASSACNAYDWFRVTGYVQEGFTNKADIVFVIDNSTSMQPEAEAVASNISAFIDAFATDDAPPTTASLANDVDRYLRQVSDRSGNVNYQIGVTTTEVGKQWGNLVGERPLIRKTDDDVEDHFQTNVLCDAACITPLPQECEGSGNNCADNSFGTAEEGIEAVFMAMCRAVPEPPEACFQSWWENPTIPGRVIDHPPGSGDTGAPSGGDAPPLDYFTEADVMSNDGWLREGSVVIPVILTDEGDQSRRIETKDGDVFPYDEYFKLFGHRMSWAVIGASDDGGCNTSGAADWGIERYDRLVNATNGVKIPISEPNGAGGCRDADFAQALADIGGLLKAVSSVYPLGALPEPGTIVVRVGKRSIDESEASYDADLDATVYSDGWSWSPGDNTVVLHGSAVPEPGEDVRVWYLPSATAPRDLPF